MPTTKKSINARKQKRVTNPAIYASVSELYKSHERRNMYAQLCGLVRAV